MMAMMSNIQDLWGCEYFKGMTKINMILLMTIFNDDHAMSISVNVSKNSNSAMHEIFRKLT